ncbi:hypothetical protein GRI44_13235 [Altererythrobacter confluentis]|uniref:DUF2939 family protein n=1 Tax=Allopontixanthobacter confluentis TaxID=1849021 RepID=A0A6L7GI31_9SPHN|nr:hypothetical protein [Allopontixanthobacter confluentis]MXP15713.1 hypothetical protein [Allopontixanthobacter confluentis]
MTLSTMRFARSLIAAVIIMVTALLFLGWYILSPRLAISQLSDWNTEPENLIALYDRERVRSAFEQQMLPQVDTYPPPLTKSVVLDAMCDPRAVRAFVVEPYGEWQFAAATGLPEELATKEPTDVMPRLMETTEDWEFERKGISEFIASPSDRKDQEGNSYRFERDGLGWRLVAIELTTEIR